MKKKNLNPLQAKPAIRSSVGNRIQTDLVTELVSGSNCGDEITASIRNFYNPYIQKFSAV